MAIKSGASAEDAESCRLVSTVFLKGALSAVQGFGVLTHDKAVCDAASM